MIYKKKHGAHLRTSAQIVGEVCEGLEAKGNLTPQALVDASRPEDAPLHNEFEWDDAKAAEAYRCDQARYIIRSIEVVPEQTEHPVRAFVSIPEEVVDGETDDDVPEDAPKQRYHHVNAVMRSEKSRDAVLAQAFKEMAAFRRKYCGFAELAGVFAEMDKLVA